MIAAASDRPGSPVATAGVGLPSAEDMAQIAALKTDIRRVGVLLNRFVYLGELARLEKRAPDVAGAADLLAVQNAFIALEAAVMQRVVPITDRLSALLRETGGATAGATRGATTSGASGSVAKSRSRG